MAALASGSALVLPKLAWPFAQSPTRIRKFVVPLQGLGPTGIPVATPDTTTFPGQDPEYLSDTPVVNGSLYPYLPVEQRHYRFRILNGSQARSTICSSITPARKIRASRTGISRVRVSFKLETKPDSFHSRLP
jgi:FtsP/CotA-like multicopper oxidase with cupredoxin domain